MLKELQNNLRKDNITPYWTHPLSVANYIRTLQFPDDYNFEGILIVALAHDILEDTDCSNTTFEATFGTAIFRQVDILTKETEPPFNSTKLYYDAICRDQLCVVVKAADRMHNLSTMVGVFSN